MDLLSLTAIRSFDRHGRATIRLATVSAMVPGVRLVGARAASAAAVLCSLRDDGTVALLRSERTVEGAALAASKMRHPSCKNPTVATVLPVVTCR